MLTPTHCHKNSQLSLANIGLLFVGMIFTNASIADDEKVASTNKLDISGKLMLDYYQVDDLFLADDYADFVIRRADVKAEYQFNDDWQSEVKVAYDQLEQTIELKDALLTNSQLSFADVSIGRFKEPMGFEYNSSSAKIMAMERSMVTNAFVPKRNIGVMISAEHKKLQWALGWFNNAEDNDFSETALTGRMTYLASVPSPFAAINEIRLHFGSSFSLRSHNPDDSIRINQSFEIYGSNSVIESTKIDATHERLNGLEFGLLAGPINLHGEYFSQHITANKNSNDLDSEFSGYYTQLTYNVTGESVNYKKGKLASVKPTAEYGAVTLVARYSELDVRDHFDGSEATSLYYGLNYTYDKNLRAQLGYQIADLYGKNSIFLNHGKALSFRLQYVY